MVLILFIMGIVSCLVVKLLYKFEKMVLIFYVNVIKWIEVVECW